MNEASSVKHSSLSALLTLLSRARDFAVRHPLAVVVVFASVIYSQYQFQNLPVGGDRANWDYMAQVISRGGVPYRDVVNIKTPLASYIGAVAIVALRPIGVQDVYAIRIVFIIFGIATVAAVFVVSMTFFGSLRAAALGSLILLAFAPLIIGNCGGTQPKTSMMLFGLITLWATMKDRPVLAGVSAMLAALSWQPGLLFLGVAALGFSRYGTRWRDSRVLKLLAAAAVPLLVFIVYFWVAGALEEMYLWTLDFNVSEYAAREVKSTRELASLVGRLVWKRLGDERLIVILSALALLFLLVRELRRMAVRGRLYLLDSASHHGILLAPVIYLAFCTVSFQGIGDLFPLIPFLAMFLGVAVVLLLDKAPELLLRRLPEQKPVLFDSALGVVAALIFLFNVADAFVFSPGAETIHAQKADVTDIVSHLGPGDRLFVHGATEVLVLSGLNNASKYILLDRGKDSFLDKVEPGGFAGWLENLKASKPKVVAVSRLNPVDRGFEFRQWVSEHYDRRQGRMIEYFVIKNPESVPADNTGIPQPPSSFR